MLTTRRRACSPLHASSSASWRTSRSATTTSTSRCARRGIIVTNTPGVLTEATADSPRADARGHAAHRRRRAAVRPARWGLGVRLLLGRVCAARRSASSATGDIGRRRRRARARVRHAVVYTQPRRRRRARARTCRSTSCCEPPTSSRCTARSRPRRATSSSRRARPHEADARTSSTPRAARGRRGGPRRGARARRIAGAGLDVFEQEPGSTPGSQRSERRARPHSARATVETRTAWPSSRPPTSPPSCAATTRRRPSSDASETTPPRSLSRQASPRPAAAATACCAAPRRR